MRYEPLGRTGARISRLALGTAVLGVVPLERDADAFIGRAIDLGINAIDTANSYGNQSRFDRPGAPSADQRRSSEEIIGKALKGRRDKVLVCSKVMEPVGDGPNDRGLSRLHIMDQVERSLKRLQTDRIDVYHAHRFDPAAPIDEMTRAFDDLVRQGKVIYPAVSGFVGWQLTEALWAADRMGAAAPILNQVRYNPFARDMEIEVLPALRRFGLSATVWGPLNGGLFAGEEVLSRALQGHQRWGGPGFDPRQIEVGRGFHAIAREAGLHSAQLALAWLFTKPGVAAAIVGPESIAEMEALCPAGDLDLPPAVVKAIDDLAPPPYPVW